MNLYVLSYAYAYSFARVRGRAWYLNANVKQEYFVIPDILLGLFRWCFHLVRPCTIC
jgi:hypothetical protein